MLRAKKKVQLLDILAKMKYPMKEFQDLFIFVKDLMPLPNKLESIVSKTTDSRTGITLPSRQQTEQILLRAEQEAQRAQRAEKEAQRAQQMHEKSVWLLFDEFKISPNQIAKKLGLALSEVKKILARQVQNGH